jgi:hypothetical protein
MTEKARLHFLNLATYDGDIHRTVEDTTTFILVEEDMSEEDKNVRIKNTLV